MNTPIWRKLWAFLNQPLFEQNSAPFKRDLELLERCWNTLSIQDAEPDLDVQLLERCWNMPCNQDVQRALQLLERCWKKSCIKPECDR